VPIRLGVLDQSPIPEGQRIGDALRNTLDLARLTDTLGYTRYWLAEHHGAASLACSSPEVMVGPVAAATSRIRVGTGGIMLPHYSPLKVAECFGMLAGLFPGRIDLGLGRAAGTSPRIAHALRRDKRLEPLDDFPQQLEELMGYLHNARPDSPLSFECPQMWLLGSSPQSAEWAAFYGLPYAFADFINPYGSTCTFDYRTQFRACPTLARHRQVIAVSAICAETDDEAMWLSASLRMMLVMLFRGRPIPVPPPDRALEFIRAEGFPMETLPVGRRIITGSPKRVRAALEQVADEYQAEEVLVVTNTFDHAARRRSYELLAAEFNLQ
jgi:luciferase family oxidoreductase group 1